MGSGRAAGRPSRSSRKLKKLPDHRLKVEIAKLKNLYEIVLSVSSCRFARMCCVVVRFKNSSLSFSLRTWLS